MEVEFDKEIDALLRKAQRDGPVLVGDLASVHLDADELSAFAENAMPEKARALQMVHLADCDRCRKILSNLLVMNAEALPSAASPSVITIAERAELPWYRQLLRFPNLAYLMGGLVLIFGGFLGFSVLQNSEMTSGVMVSQAPEGETRGGPNFQTEPQTVEMNSAANSAANMTVTNGVGTANSNSVRQMDSGPAGPRANEENSLMLDGADAAGAQPAAAPPPAVGAAAAAPRPEAKDVRERDDLAKEKAEVSTDTVTVAGQEPAKHAAALKQQQSYSNMPTQSGPSRRDESQYNRQLENLDRRAAAAKRSVPSDGDSSSGRKVVSGKTFERKQGVWYDTTFQGRPTINVRRGSAEFNRLEGGLKSIANSLSGTIVVVWGAKAYRIQ